MHGVHNPFERGLNFSIKVADLWSAVQAAGMHINFTFSEVASEEGGKRRINERG